MYKVLVIGCGNIGAQYDIDNDEVQTHVKAWYLNSSVNLSIFDINHELLAKVASKYKCEIVNDISSETLSKFDIVCICTPTFTHFEILKNAIEVGVKTIICEKPISNSIEEMIELKEIYSKGHSKILVNYIRRFQPSFISLKSFIQDDLDEENLTNISIRYQRGFINNCSHAMDLIEFLIGKEINLNQIKIHNVVFDQFENDATLSLMSLWDKVNFDVLGLGNVLFSHFEIDLYFKKHKISIKNAGNLIEIFKSEGESTFLLPLNLQENLGKKDCLKNYMIPVTDYAVKLMENKELEDNFINSITLNLKMLNYKNN
ncbi:Gfo/Idh/MocA family oxidoreductase [Flavobacterium tructae]|uniref:Gfo/Idh/MocA family protein n=1 Tax=Flavobacterium tructae TaxID=1114873 RepID=UPI002551F9FC|nr:Gfo/Idh/MocA family oxidoreductase [Flavobacterium tructae]MDL2143319.1 Gfo/Idh/MocA family oxidoreductase [Flavobacterium tructae]